MNCSVLEAASPSDSPGFAGKWFIRDLYCDFNVYAPEVTRGPHKS